MSETRERAEELFAHALSLPATERRNYLEQACTSDEALLGEVEALLRGHADGEFLETAAFTGLVGEAVEEHIDRYKLLRKIGEGGCGIVYLAEQTEPVRRRVALKVIKLGMDTREVIARFEAERQALALMDHPNIARVFDCGATEAGRPFFVMELVQGIPITQYCEDRRLAVPARLELFIAVCRAIQHAHEKGIVHRDIKPSNILVTLYDGMPVPKVIDFGVAKATEARLTDKTLYTAYAEFIGTPIYMSPEQADLGVVDARSDVYSLGVLLYELLTGFTPFEAKDLTGSGLEEMRRRVREEDPVRPSRRLAAMAGDTLASLARRRRAEPPRLIASLRGDLDWIVMRCVEKEPARRYATAVALAEDIGCHLRNEPVVAAAPAFRHTLRRLVRRHRAAGLTAAAGLALAAAGVAYALARRSALEAPPAAFAISPRSVAVLPFANLSPDPGNAFFADGVHEDVITTLAKIRDLQVISRTSVMVYKSRVENVRAIAADLGVANVLEGSVRRVGNKVRVTAELVDARTDRPLWANTYDRELTDVFAIETGIAEDIAGALRSSLTADERKLMGQRPTSNREAYDLDLRARIAFQEGRNRQSLSRLEAAQKLFEQAIAMDPKFALAFAHLALVHCELYRFPFYDPTPARLARARDAAGAAVRLDPGLPDAKLALGMIAFVGPCDFAQALHFFREAEEGLPNDDQVLTWTGSTLQRLGRWNESLEYMERSAERNPGTVAGAVGQLQDLFVMRHYQKVVQVAKNYLRRFPDDRTINTIFAFAQFELDGDRGAFLERAARVRLAPNDPFGLYHAYLMAMMRRDLVAAGRALFDPRLVRNQSLTLEIEDPVVLTRAFYSAYTGRTEQARAYADQALAYYRAGSWNRAQQPWVLLGEAKAEAYKGDSASAVRDAQAVWAAISGSDAVDAFLLQPAIGHVFIMAGKNEAALAVLRAIMDSPYGMGPEDLRWEPVWSRLRGDPRFEAILRSRRPL